MNKLPIALLLLALVATSADGILTIWTIRYAGLGFLVAIVLLVVAIIILSIEDSD